MPAQARLLRIRGACEHNLRDVDLDLPHGSFIVVSGVSGSGKTSLACDTVYAEARRRFLGALERGAGGLTRRLRPPCVRLLEGLTPAVAIGQEGMRPNPRATVATLAGVHDYLRLLFARLGKPRCTACGAPVHAQRFEEVFETAAGLREGTRVLILALRRPVPGEETAERLAGVDRAGYRRLRLGAEVLLLEDIDPARVEGQPLEVVIDRLVIRPDTVRRLKGSLQAALELGDGQVLLALPDSGAELSFAVRPACSACGAPFRPITPSLFSFNSVEGACPECRGLGAQSGAAFAQVFDDGRASLQEALGALWQEFGHGPLRERLERFAQRQGKDLDAPLAEWSPQAASRLWGGGASRGGFPGVMRLLERLRGEAAGAELDWFEGLLSETPCPACGGTRLRPESLCVTVHGESISSLTSLSIAAALRVLEGWTFAGSRAAVGQTLAAHAAADLRSLCDLGLGYLGLDRRGDSLSSGESQRLRLGAALGSAMSQVLYVLDEPTVGLHARDVGRLLAALERLRGQGNTLLVVEHDRAVIERADLVVDMGPGAGTHGGRVVAVGPPAAVAAGDGLTGQYLAGRLRLGGAPRRALGEADWLRLEGARGHNLAGDDVAFPLGALTCVTGVSGSGKSTLVQQTLYPLLAARLHGAQGRPLPYAACLGTERLQRVVGVDQRPIGRSPRSNAATYTGLMDSLRRLFAELPESRLRGYRPGHFSFNAPEGACPECGGSGIGAVRQGVVEDLVEACPACAGRRFRGEVLDIRWRGRSVAEVLEATVEEAAQVFAAVPEVARRLRLLAEVGLGYLRLGQPATSLSGGEAQRVKLAAELGRPQQAHTLYILDEPTTGLHLEDVRYLLELLQRLVEQGNTVIVVEHHLELVAAADWVIDLGPEGGEGGGRVVVAGSPEAVAATEASWTGRCLRAVLAWAG
ncbi:MAG: excinuclease ABC subunit UvrA [Candidatus Latescibacterota bacterium]